MMDANEILFKIRAALPISDISIEDYYNRCERTIQTNYLKGEYQVAYFHIHLLFMTYVYNTIWQIKQLKDGNYNLASLFARPYNGKTLKHESINTVFDYSNLPEKDSLNYLHAIGIDNSEIQSFKNIIGERDEMAHASGNYKIEDIETFEAYCKSILKAIETIEEALYEDAFKKEFIVSMLNKANENYKTVDLDYFNEHFVDILSITYNQLIKFLNIGKAQFSRLLANHKTKVIRRTVKLYDKYKLVLTQVYNEYLDENGELTAITVPWI